MDFEWDSSKERANLGKHGIDFRTAARIFLDPYMIEFDDLHAFCHLYNEGRYGAHHLCERSGAA